MKKIILLCSLFLVIPLCFADVPLDEGRYNQITSGNFNYLLLALGIMFVIGILVFIYIYKKEIKSK